MYRTGKVPSHIEKKKTEETTTGVKCLEVEGGVCAGRELESIAVL